MSDQGAVEHWAQVDRLLDRVLALPIADRAAFVQQQTTDDPRLRDEVMALLADLGTRGDLLDRPALGALSRGVPALGLQPGHRIGAYKVLGLLGQGGMGEVYRAERADGQFDHEVAIKVLRQDAVEHLGLFVSERRILAKLEHPGIARLYDAGIGDDGRPYMVMELVEGILITHWCRERKADLKQRLELFAQVCDAVAYAHQNLIIHRDLKPGNILVTDDGRTKLLDFGVALLSGTAEDATRNAPMTLSYAAPEQLTRAAMSTATDIYALGVLLFELLTERLPWATAQMPIATAIDNVLHETAPAPSAIAARMGWVPVPARLLTGDLDAIVGKALRKEPADRYATVADLQADVRKHLQGEPVVAREGAGMYVFGRFVRRYRWAVAGVVLLIGTLAAGLAGTIWQARRAETQARTTAAVQAFVTDMFRANSSSQPDPVKARATTARQLLDLGAKKIDMAMADAPAAKLSVLQLLSELYDDLGLAEEAVRLRRQTLTLSRMVHGADSTEVAAALLGLAGSMQASSTVDDREKILGEAVAILDQQRDSVSVTRGELLIKLAEHYDGLDMPKGLDYARQAVRLFEVKTPSDHLAEALSWRGVFEQDTGLMREAAISFRRAIDVSRAVDGNPNPDLPHFYAYLSEVEYRLQNIVEAEKTARLAFQTAIAINGEDHVDAVQTELRLGRILFDTGRTHQGLEHFLSAKRHALKALGGEDSLHMPQALLEHGYAQARMGLLESGLADIQSAIDIQRKSRPGTMFMATMLEIAASDLVELGRTAQAHAYLDEATSLKIKGGLERSTTRYNVNVGTRIRLALAEGQVETAQKLINEFFVDPDETMGISFTSTEKLLLTAEVELAAGRPAAAAKLAQRVRGAISKSGLAAYLKFYALRADLLEGKAALQGRQAVAALALLQRAHLTSEKLLAPGSPKIAEIKIALAECYLALGQVQRARTMATDATAIHAMHSELGEQYRRSLNRLQAGLATATR